MRGTSTESQLVLCVIVRASLCICVGAAFTNLHEVKVHQSTNGSG